MLSPPQFIKHLVESFEGDQAGEVLASFLVLKQVALPFLSEFGGIEGFLRRQMATYRDHPDCARELNIVKVALQEVAKITAALVTPQGQRPGMDFGSSPPTERAPARPFLDFGAGPSGMSDDVGEDREVDEEEEAGAPGVGPGPYQPRPLQPVAQGLHMPAGRSGAYSLALPPRSGEGIADSAGSRSDIREGMARLANRQRTAAAEHASAHPPPPSSLIRRGGNRGEMLGPQHVAEELDRVQRRIRTQQLRDESASEGEGEGEGDLGLPFRARGRGANEWGADELPRLDRGWQLTPQIRAGVPPADWLIVATREHQALRGVKVAAVWPTTARDELRWHYGGFIFDTAVRPLEGGGGMDLWVRAVFADGFEDWWSLLPDPAFAFGHQGHQLKHVAHAKLEQARRHFGI